MTCFRLHLNGDKAQAISSCGLTFDGVMEISTQAVSSESHPQVSWGCIQGSIRELQGGPPCVTVRKSKTRKGEIVHVSCSGPCRPKLAIDTLLQKLLCLEGRNQTALTCLLAPQTLMFCWPHRP